MKLDITRNYLEASKILCAHDESERSNKLKNFRLIFLLDIWTYWLPFDRNLRADVSAQSYGFVGHLDLYDEVLRCNSEAFDCISPGKQGLLTFLIELSMSTSLPAGRVFGWMRDWGVDLNFIIYWTTCVVAGGLSKCD